MSDREPRLGDIVDDYCTRCRLLMNHGVVGLVGTEIKRVRCSTCMTEHAFRHGKLPRQRKDQVKQLFDEVLAKIPTPAEKPSSPESPPRRRSPHLGRRPPSPGASGGGRDKPRKRRGKR